jgi:hypothetical protein
MLDLLHPTGCWIARCCTRAALRATSVRVQAIRDVNGRDRGKSNEQQSNRWPWEQA